VTAIAPPQPDGHSVLELVVDDSECNQNIHIEKIFHGNSARISSTSLLVSTGAPGPAVRTGRPVTGCLMILARGGRALWGVRTMRPASTLASSESPARMPSLRRRGPGRTIWPLVETLVCTLRQSYHQQRPRTSFRPNCSAAMSISNQRWLFRRHPRRAVGFFRSGRSTSRLDERITQSTSGQLLIRRPPISSRSPLPFYL